MTATKRPSTPRLVCSLCRSRVDPNALHLYVIRHDVTGGCSAGRFCDAECLEAMEAVDAVREFQGDDEIADALLAAYRIGRGPRATLVLEAVRVAQARGYNVECAPWRAEKMRARTCVAPSAAVAALQSNLSDRPGDGPVLS